MGVSHPNLAKKKTIYDSCIRVIFYEISSIFCFLFPFFIFLFFCRFFQFFNYCLNDFLPLLFFLCCYFHVSFFFLFSRILWFFGLICTFFTLFAQQDTTLMLVWLDATITYPVRVSAFISFPLRSVKPHDYHTLHMCLLSSHDLFVPPVLPLAHPRLTRHMTHGQVPTALLLERPLVMSSSLLEAYPCLQKSRVHSMVSSHRMHKIMKVEPSLGSWQRGVMRFIPSR